MLAELDLQSKLDSNGIPQKISSGEHDGSGISCQFYPLGGGLGLKMYYRRNRSEQMRDNNYIMQSHMHKLGLAPAVYNKVQIGDLYGFVTEMCDIPAKKYKEISNEDGWKAAEAYSDLINKEIDKLERKLPSYVLACDTGLNNCGYTADGEIKFVDCGNFTVSGSGSHVDECKPERLEFALAKYV